MSLAVEARTLVKHFGAVTALDGITFDIREREIYGLIGPNGAGKTTTLRIICTLLLPTSGSIRIFGMNPETQAEKVRRIISYLPEEAGTYPNLSGDEYLKFMAKFNTENQKELQETYKEAAKISGLGERLKDRTKLTVKE